MSAPATDLAERYGAPRPGGRRLVVVVAVVLIAVSLAWVTWVSLDHSRPEVTSELVGYDIGGQHAATATFTVVRSDTQVAASCLLRAFAADHSVVGELTVPVTSGRTTARITSTVRTEREATSLDLIGCRTADQASRR